MKAIVAHAAKDLRIEERDEPDLGPGQVLVKMAAGGICGSDLHYYNHGGFGTITLKEPMILGHEVAGHIVEVADNVTNLAPKQLVAVSPSRPCRVCVFCQRGMQNQCTNMRFYGSAMPFPHIQGAFRELLVADAAQCSIADGLTPHKAALAEPLSVVLHAAKLAGDLQGKRVLVTGSGPIGLLAVSIARNAGAIEVVATDVTDFTLQKARDVGADTTFNVTQIEDPFKYHERDKGRFDILFECSGVAVALASSIPALAPGATIVQLGLGGDMTLPVQAMTAKEICLKGSFRFHSEFSTAVEMLRKGQVQVDPLLTHQLPLDEAVKAFEIASDRDQAIKVSIVF